jgi:hypothetical protein
LRSNATRVRGAASARAPGRRIAAALALCAAAAMQPCREAHADEGGASFWVPGQSAANLAASAPPPGWSLPVTYYYYSGSAPGNASEGGAVAPGTRSWTSQLAFSPTYVPAATVLGGQLALTVSFGVEGNATRLTPTNPSGPARETVWGLTDVVPAATLGWQRGSDSWAAYLMGNLPVGSYDSQRLSNTGLGRAALDAGIVGSYDSPSSGRSASVAVGVTYNFTNPDTDYRSGVDAHLGASAMVPLTPSLRAGLSGYVYYQLTADGGSGNGCGPCKSRVAGIGPQVNYAFDVAGRAWSANLRGYYEFWARNRLQGGALFASLAIPL